MSKDIVHTYIADYDGDCVSIRGIWSDEANLEAEEIMNKKTTALNISGNNSRVVSKEVCQSYFMMTKNGKDASKVSDSDFKKYLEISFKEITRSFLIQLFADTVDSSKSNNTKKRKSRHNTYDKVIIPANYFYEGQPKIETTIGRFIVNKYVLEGSGIIKETKYFNEVINKSKLGDLDSMVGTLLLEDKINRQQFNDYINRRDNLGYWCNGFLAHTISIKMLRPLDEVKKLKEE